MRPEPVAPSASVPYALWLRNVHSLLEHHRPDVRPEEIDPNASYLAFQAGDTPHAFATRPVLPLRPSTASQPSHPVPSSPAHAAGLAFGAVPDSTLVGWMWCLTVVAVVLFFGGSSLRALGLLFDAPAVVIGIVLALRTRSPARVHGWVKLCLELGACVLGLAAGARGGY